ncbi:FAD-binding oxidoreductase [Roseovarius sp. A21]|uniref:FAD-binding oxidoreductase n=1 Tax=Roseovarius bejariae TaxID=2576383 RepID=A0A844CKT1_9RHOB|nr:FAD-binding oxidoreductase [Roseovarius bejariae]MRU15347.1 FAD-binding oxidoreductase [Roseovarius bejariae]
MTATDTDTQLNDLRGILGPEYVKTGADAAPWSHDWPGHAHWTPLAVVRPANTREVAKVVQWANRTGTAIVPVSGNTGLVEGSTAEGAVMVSLDRMSAIREVRPEARVAIVEAGAILSNIHAAADAHDLIFPLTFGARGSAMIGGALSTNAGGSNVVRYGNTRHLCLGVEAVLPTGEIIDLMSELHKDNSGYDLRDLLIGAEGTLGIITAAVLKLHPKPMAYATAMVAAPSLNDALTLLNTLQRETGGAVEAFEFMPRIFMEAYLERYPEARAPFDQMHEVNILVEVGALSPRDATPGDDGRVPVTGHLEDVLGRLFEEGAILDAAVAQSDTQRQEMWARRETSAEVARLRQPLIDNDIAVPLDQIQTLLEQIVRKSQAIDPDLIPMCVAHLGDGNLHFAGWPSTDDPDTLKQIKEMVDDTAIALGGSFSAEHGVGLTKKPAMARHKNPVALQAMRAIKQALDPKGIMNPGKVLPEG